MSERKGDWIQTYSGGKFWALDPRPEEVNIMDIAHALSLQCRFNGQCDSFYSVAAHSVNVAEFIAQTYHDQDPFYSEYLLDEADVKIDYEDMIMWGLLHDASEAYLPDVPRPIKKFLPEYKAVEDGVMKVVAEKFELPELGEEHENYLKAVDYLLCLVEHKDLGMSGKAPEDWPAPDFLKRKWPTITLVLNDDWEKDKKEFLEYFETLAVRHTEIRNGAV